MPRWAAIPKWQITILKTLGKHGDLHGVTPIAMSAVAKAEEPGTGNEGVNATGYGGYFGLSTATAPASLLSTSSHAAFKKEAEISSVTFSKILYGEKGTYVKAENAYQTGLPTRSANGAAIMRQSMGGAKATTKKLTSKPGGSTAGGVTPTKATPGAIPTDVAHAVGGVFSPLIAWVDSGAKKVGLIVFGAVLVIAALVMLMHGFTNRAEDVPGAPPAPRPHRVEDAGEMAAEAAA